MGRTVWIEDGVLKYLASTRYWAVKSGVPHQASPTNLLMRGGAAKLDAMIRATDRGLLVTRLWYLRVVDPRTLLLTGLTRDGLFLIDKGHVTGAVRNLRFNESPLGVLSRADMIGEARRFGAATDRGDVVLEAPAIRSHEFTFTSVSDAV
jgi:predicted Zn-dependent protease